MTELSLFNVSGNSFGYLYLGYSVSKKTELIRFRFYKPEIKKNKKKSSQTGKNRANQKKIEPSQFEPVFILKNRTEPKPVGLNRFHFFLKQFNLIIFFNKN